ncbi:MAG TPA: hypothetical protein VLK25_05790 [Allosphingosinicella sp.]|nr:hypothetical protein [Allosphingosinicella sp.]
MAEPFREIGIDLDVHRAIERARLSFGESANDILRRLLLPRRGGERAPAAAAPGSAHAEPRRRGLWTVEIGGRKIPAANLKHAYRTLLVELAASHPHFLDAFGEERARGRRMVARTPEALFARSPHLAPRHAAPLVHGWYFDSNLSAEQVGKRARVAARLCALHYGSDVRILDNLREV